MWVLVVRLCRLMFSLSFFVHKHKKNSILMGSDSKRPKCYIAIVYICGRAWHPFELMLNRLRKKHNKVILTNYSECQSDARRRFQRFITQTGTTLRLKELSVNKRCSNPASIGAGRLVWLHTADRTVQEGITCSPGRASQHALRQAWFVMLIWDVNYMHGF